MLYRRRIERSRQDFFKFRALSKNKFSIDLSIKLPFFPMKKANE